MPIAVRTVHSTLKYPLLVLVMALASVTEARAQSFSDVIQSALLTYPSLQAAKAKTVAAKADIDRARAVHYPQISYGVTASKYATTDLPASILPTMNSPSVKLNLWSGGRIEADARRAKALTTVAEFTEATTRDDVAQAAAEAYLNWARALAMFELATQNLESHRTTLSDIQKIVNVDTGRSIDMEQAKVRVDNAKLALLQRQTELGQARQRLLRFWPNELSSRPSGLVQVFSPTGRLSPMPQTHEEVMTAVTDDLPAVSQQKAQVAAAKAAVDAAYGLHWPTVDLTASRQLNPITTGSTVTYKLDTLTQLTASMPVYNGGAASAAVDAAAAQLKAAEYALDEARLLARERASFAYEDWLNAKGRAAEGANQARVGDKVVEGYRLQFRLARRQLLDLLNIQAEVFGYQSAATTAYFDEQISRVKLLASIGNLANRFDQP